MFLVFLKPVGMTVSGSFLLTCVVLLVRVDWLWRWYSSNMRCTAGVVTSGPGSGPRRRRRVVGTGTFMPPVEAEGTGMGPVRPTADPPAPAFGAGGIVAWGGGGGAGLE